MFLSFLLAALAGYGVPFAEPKLVRLAEAILGEAPVLAQGELRIVTLLAMLGLSAFIVMIAGYNSSSLATVLGGALGYFGTRLYAFVRDPDGINRTSEDGAWDGALRPPGARQTPRSKDVGDGTGTDDEATLRAVGQALQEDAEPSRGGSTKEHDR
ncbi:MAG: hypothetical protein AAGJ91_09445 [Pseudomonadota bacterium]